MRHRARLHRVAARETCEPFMTYGKGWVTRRSAAATPRRSARWLACALVLWLALDALSGTAGTPRLDEERMHSAMLARYGNDGVDALEAWLAMLAGLEGEPVMRQLEVVNQFFNRHVRFSDDLETWGMEDYWATPLETLGERRGDCEDYSIAKYVSLRLLGIPDNRLRLTYVRARVGGPASRLSQAHMVLSYYPEPGAVPYVLDNLVTGIRRADQRPDLQPVFSFNGEGLWAGDADTSLADPTARLSRWRNVLQRMEQEGVRR